MTKRILKRPVQLLIVLLLACLITIPTVTLSSTSAQITAANGEYYNKTFTWTYNGNQWNWNLSIPKALYDAYNAVPDSTRTRNGPAGYGFLTTTQDYYMRVLAQKLNETTTSLKYNTYDQVSFILAFVQSLPYTADNVTTGFDEYPRFPIETLVDDGGDCEDTSILFATLTLILGYGTVYINPPNHYAVGVLGNNLHGTYWTYQNNTYYYCETTGNNFKIGQLPDEFQGQQATIYSINQDRQFDPQVTFDPTMQTPVPTNSPWVVTTKPTPTSQPNPTGFASPNVPAPTQEPVEPISFNLITESPLLFAIILMAIVGSIAATVWSVRRSKEMPQSSEAATQETEETIMTEDESGKFCIFCGSSNKGVAVYCEKCGKQIGGS
ncbi:MAG TPA: hypothetical protein VLL96_06205 [Candidatus Deferrimicrobiaceae bacterium]|nr:hypothetical protein [Candidatus Deferrimicrobiaceae bacterium]